MKHPIMKTEVSLSWAVTEASHWLLKARRKIFLTTKLVTSSRDYTPLLAILSKNGFILKSQHTSPMASFSFPFSHPSKPLMWQRHCSPWHSHCVSYHTFPVPHCPD